MQIMELAKFEKLMSLVPSGREVSLKILATCSSLPFPLHTFSISPELYFKYFTNVWLTYFTFCCSSEQFFISSPNKGSSYIEMNNSFSFTYCFMDLQSLLMDFKIQQTYPTPASGLSSFNTLTYLHSSHCLFLYGLQKLSAEPQAEQPKKKISFKASKDPAPPSLDKISVFSLQERKWSVIEAKGKIPTPREDFCALEISKCLILFGGKSNGKYLNEVVALNVENNMWKKIFSLEGPAASKDPIVIKTSPTSACLFSAGALWLLEMADVKWELAANELPGSVWEKLNIQLPQQALFLWQINIDEILLVTLQKAFVISLKDKGLSRSFAFEGKQILNPDKKLKTALLPAKGQFYSPRMVVAFEDHLQALEYENQESQRIRILPLSQTQSDKEENYIKLQKTVHCLTAIDEDFLFYVDPKGELVSVSFSFQKQDTTRLIIGNKQNSQGEVGGGKIGDFDFQNCIEEEEELEESSSYLMHNSDSQVKLPTHHFRVNSEDSDDQRDERKQLMRSHDSPITKKEGGKKIINPYSNKISQKRSESKGQYLESEFRIDYEETQSENSILLKNKLATILTHEHLKRRLLEEKAEALERTIKKSEKFVFLLCKYGQQREKLKHIQKVKELRQELQVNWGKQNYFRKEMQNDRIPSKIGNMVEKVLTDAKRDSQQFNTE